MQLLDYIAGYTYQEQYYVFKITFNMRQISHNMSSIMGKQSERYTACPFILTIWFYEMKL